MYKETNINSIEVYSGFRAELAIIETYEQIKQIETKAAVMAEIAKKAKIGIDEQNEWGIFRIEIEAKKGEWLNEHFPYGVNAKFRSSDVTNSLTMSEIGITPDESANARAIHNKPEVRKKAIDKIVKSKNKIITPNAVAAEIRKIEKEIKTQEKQEYYKEIARDKPLNDDVVIHNTDFVEFAKSIADGSIDLILTDPPYPADYLPLWDELFKMSSKILKPSGFLIAYSGQLYLDKIFEYANASDMNYYWTMSIEFTKKPLIHPRNVINEWKPILIFQNGIKKSKTTFADKISMTYTERELHDKNWGQTVEPFELLLEIFSNPGDMIFEPFLGSGTTAIACINKGRKCIATELNTEMFNIAKGRIYEMQQ